MGNSYLMDVVVCLPDMDTMPAASHALAEYDARLEPYRRAFADAPALAFLGEAHGDPALLHLFLIHFSAFGIAMTRPVADWIRRAGERCRETGIVALGEALTAHASHEAGHHRLMIADLWALADRWNAGHSARIDPLTLGRAALPASVRDYAALHEEVIAGAAPWAQIALEYEIEMLSIRHGPSLVAAADGALSSAGNGLSFLREHVALDAAHTKFNRRQLAALLDRAPGCLDALAAAGARALEIYGRFIEDCLRAALAFESGTAKMPLECRLFGPPGAAAAQSPPEWLLRVRSLRTHVLYDGGTRPAFGPGGNSFGDRDAADLYCHHLVLFDDGLPIGAARLRLPGGRGPSLVDRSFGAATVDDCLARRGFARANCAEASRLVMHPDHRRGRVAGRLIAGLWALAAESGAGAIVAAVGTSAHQDRLFAFFGAEMLDEAGRVHAPQFGDDLRLVLYRVNTAAPPDYPELDHMREFVRRAFGRPAA